VLRCLFERIRAGCPSPALSINFPLPKPILQRCHRFETDRSADESADGEPKLYCKTSAVSGVLAYRYIEEISYGNVVLYGRQWCAILLFMSAQPTRSDEEGDLMNLQELTKDELVAYAAELRRELAESKKIGARLTQAEEALRENEEKYRLLFEKGRDGVVVHELESMKFVDANPAAEVLWGYTKDELMTMTPMDLSLEPDKTKEALEQGARPGGTQVPIRWQRKKDGSSIAVEISASQPFTWKNRNVLCSIVRDITEQKRAEEALLRSEAQLSSAVTMAHLGHWEYDVTKDLFTFNDHFYKIFRTTVEQVGGYTMSSAEYASRFVHPDDMAVVGEETRKAIESTDPRFSRQLEHRILYADGEIGYITVRFFIIKDDLGHTVKTYGVNQDITDRKRAEEALRREQVFTGALLENMVDGVVACGEDGNLALFNRTAREWHGLDPMAVPAEKWAEYYDLYCADGITPMTVATVPLSRAFRGEVLVNEGMVIRAKGQPARHILANCAPFFDEKGRKLGAVAVMNDITDRKRAEEALRESEQRYRAVVDNIEIGISLLSHDLEIVEVNRVFREFFPHIQPGCGQICYEQYNDPPRSGPCSYCPTVLTIQDGEVHEAITETPAGSEIRHYHLVSSPIKDSDGQVQYVIEMVEDITDRKRAEETLRLSEERYRSLFEHAPLMYAITRNEQGIPFICDCNEQFLRSLGYAREEVLGKPLADFYSPESCKELLEHGGYSQALAGEFFIGERQLLTKNGRLVPTLLYTTVEMDALGHVTGTRAMFVDITERKEAEQEQEHLRAQLFQAQKMESVGTLAGGIAHDFNNLLQVTLGYSELLLQEKTEHDACYGDLQKIFQAAKSGAELVRSLLAFSRKAEPKPVPMNLNHEIRHVEKLLHRTIPRMIDIRLDLAEDLERINADPAQIEQIIMNLAVNARDAMGEEGSLKIRTENVTLDDEYCRFNVEAKPGDYILLSVSDTGHGMDRETRQRIFEPFYTTKELGRGTGLGLAMVYGIVRQHGGHIDCYSEVGKGTTFKLYFPVIPSIEEPAVEATGIMPAFGTETVLLVDDEDLVRDLGQRILTRSGYTVLTAARGEEALEVYGREKEHIALVILDLIMPTMGGKDCLKKILKIDPQARILISSGYSADASTKECLGIGAKGFVAKPFRFKEFLQQVRMALDEG
jgi:PAS domain S-box-containing protein